MARLDRPPPAPAAGREGARRPGPCALPPVLPAQNAPAANQEKCNRLRTGSHGRLAGDGTGASMATEPHGRAAGKGGPRNGPQKPATRKSVCIPARHPCLPGIRSERISKDQRLQPKAPERTRTSSRPSPSPIPWAASPCRAMPIIAPFHILPGYGFRYFERGPGLRGAGPLGCRGQGINSGPVPNIDRINKYHRFSALPGEPRGNLASQPEPITP